MSRDQLWVEYVWVVRCIDDAGAAIAILDELVRREDPQAMHDRAVMILYNDETGDDARGVALLEMASAMGNANADVALYSWRNTKEGE